MRICFFGNLQVIHLQRWVDYFKEKNHDVHVVTSQPTKINNVSVHNISFLNKEITDLRVMQPIIHFYREIYKTLYLGGLIDKIKPDIINAHYLTNYGILAAKLNRHPLVLTCWGSDVLIAPEKFGEQHLSEMKKALSKADLITVVSEHMEEELIKMGIKKNIIVNPFGIKISKFNPNGKKNKVIKEKFANKKIIVSTRNLEPIYNVECLIKALPSAIKENENVVTLICGSGSLENKLKKLVNSLGLNEHVYFLGRITHETMPEYLRSADMYVSTSLSDGTSISLLEAMSCGLFPIVTDIPANRPWIKHGENGFLFEKGDYNKLSELILEIIDDGRLIKNVAKTNQEIVKENGDWKKNTRKLERLYVDLAK